MPRKETDGLKLSVETSQEIIEKRIEKAEGKVSPINSSMTRKLMNYGKKISIYVRR